LFVLALLLAAGDAKAQVHWDAEAQAGVVKRFTTGGGSGAPMPGFGPSLELQGHVALVPMVRLGAYLSTDLSPVSTDGEGPRTFWEGGLHVRFSPPLVGYPWRVWLFAGFGYAYTYDVGTRLSGGMLDVPVGLGLGSKLTRHTMLFAELGARFGFGFYGPMYTPGSASGGSETGGGPAYLGNDSVALSLSVGLSLEE